MDPITIYDYLTTARRLVLDKAGTLSAEAYLQPMAVGLGSVGRTLTHIMISEWYYVQRMTGASVPPYAEWPIQDEHPPPFETLDSTWRAQAVTTRATLTEIQDWNATVEYPGSTDGRAQIVTATVADLMTQLAFHEVHHRAQAMIMLRRLDAAVEDLDFNSFFERRDA